MRRHFVSLFIRHCAELRLMLDDKAILAVYAKPQKPRDVGQGYDKGRLVLQASVYFRRKKWGFRPTRFTWARSPIRRPGRSSRQFIRPQRTCSRRWARTRGMTTRGPITQTGRRSSEQ